MKLQCSIKILNLLLTNLSVSQSSKYQKAVIYIKRQDKDYFLIIVTQNNKTGSRYKISGNIEKTFGQFSNEGKCTVRFKEPYHDVLITAESVSLKNFMLYIKKAWKNELNDTDTVCKPVSNNIEGATHLYRLRIDKRQDYPVLKEFPKTLQSLWIENCKLTKFDSRLLKLNNLTQLSLSKNKLTAIPEKLGSLHLKKLTLDNNDLKNEDWKFLSGPILSTLEVLDISNNQIVCIPPILCRFRSLSTFKASKNLLRSIPFRIILLPKLQELDVSYNMLKALPGTVYGRQFTVLDISGNEELADAGMLEDFTRLRAMRRKFNAVVPSLLELAGMVTIHCWLEYSEEVLPRTLAARLDNATLCFCGHMTLKTYGWEIYVTERWKMAKMSASANPNSLVPICFTSCAYHSST